MVFGSKIILILSILGLLAFLLPLSALPARQEEGLLGRSPKTSVEDADAGIGLRRLSIGKGAT